MQQARMAKLVNVAVSEAVENCLLRVRVSLRAHPFRFEKWDIRFETKIKVDLTSQIYYLMSLLKPRWRNWQTHHLEGVAFVRMWRFESAPGHIFFN
jgi:hypothetical protein